MSTEIPSSRAEARKMAAKGSGKGSSNFTKVMVIVALVAAVAVAVVLTLNSRSAEVPATGSTPAGGNENGGITLVTETTLAQTEIKPIGTAVLPSDEKNEEPQVPGLKVAAGSGPIQVVIYQDANCSHCHEFEKTNGPLLSHWLAQGLIELEHRNVAILDSGSPTNFSSRAANALACVANTAPASYLSFSDSLFGHQPEGEMKNAQLTAMALKVGADIDACVNEGTFRPFVKYTTASSQAAGIPGTPAVYVNGDMWDGAENPDFQSWVDGILAEER